MSYSIWLGLIDHFKCYAICTSTYALACITLRGHKAKLVMNKLSQSWPPNNNFNENSNSLKAGCIYVCIWDDIHYLLKTQIVQGDISFTFYLRVPVLLPSL